MVLIFIFILSFFVSDPPHRYEKQIEKTIKKELKLDQEFNLRLESDSTFYSIWEDTVLKGYIKVTEVAACHLGGCVSAFDIKARENEGLGSEYFDALFLLDVEMTIVKIKILDYFSDYGYEVNSRRYLKKFEGKNVCDFAAGKDGIDGISGATISSMALEGVLALMCEN